MAKERMLPKVCPCLELKILDCSRHNRQKDSHYCYGDEYIYCPGFSSWFWFNVAKQQSKRVQISAPELPLKITIEGEEK